MWQVWPSEVATEASSVPDRFMVGLTASPYSIQRRADDKEITILGFLDVLHNDLMGTRGRGREDSSGDLC